MNFISGFSGIKIYVVTVCQEIYINAHNIYTSAHNIYTRDYTMVHLHSSLCMPHHVLLLEQASILTYKYYPDCQVLTVSICDHKRAHQVFTLPANDLPVYVLELLTLLLEHSEIIYSAEGSLLLPGVTGVL